MKLILKVGYKKKKLVQMKIELEERLMDLIEGSQELNGLPALYFDTEIIGILEELARLDGV